MRCNQNIKELSFYIDNKLSVKKSQALGDHILRCPDCKAVVDGLRSMRKSLNSLAPIKESADFDHNFNMLLEKRLSAKTIKLRRFKENLINLRDTVIYPIPAMVKVAASVILIVTALVGVRHQGLQKVPFVEFASGQIRIYRPSEKSWIMPKADMRLRSGDRIYSEDGAVLNIASRDRYKMRIKDKSLIVVSKLESGLRNIDTDLSISHGNLLVNTTKKFKGSSLKMYTPACDAEVVGTAFMVQVDNKNTWLGVLEGRVKILSKVHPLKERDGKRVATFVSSGQKAAIKSYYYSTVPELFTEKEWQSMQELYQMAEARQIMLLIGTGADRVDNLLKMAPLYIPEAKKSEIPQHMHTLINSIIVAEAEGNIHMLNQYAKELEAAIKSNNESDYSVNLLMFLASHYYQARNFNDAMKVFEYVIQKYPDSEMAPLAQSAIGTIYGKDLKQINKAERIYQKLLKAYPDSVDAIRAKETLSSLR